MKIVNRSDNQDRIDDNKKKFLVFTNDHDGELVLDFFRVVQLIGFAEDDEDYYYIVKVVGGVEHWISCVMDLIPLKGVLPEETYNGLFRVFELNQEEERKE